MKVQDEYRIQTEESVAWNNDFMAQKAALSSSPQVIDADREERIKHQYHILSKGLSLVHGMSKVPGKPWSIMAADAPRNTERSFISGCAAAGAWMKIPRE